MVPSSGGRNIISQMLYYCFPSFTDYIKSLKNLLALKEDNVSYLYSSAFAMDQNGGIKHKDIIVQFEMAFNPIICRLSGSEEFLWRTISVSAHLI